MGAERLFGLGSLRASFLQVADDIRVRTARSMVVTAGGVLRKEAKSLAQKQGLRRTGALIKNIAIKREKTPDGMVQYNLGVRHGRDLGRKAQKVLTVRKSGLVGVKYLNDPFYWSYLEFGRNIYKGGDRAKNPNGKRHRMRTTKTVTGRVPATPFIGPALINKRSEAIQAMEESLRKTLEKAAK